MPAITIRDIPANVLEKIRTLSEIDRRSMNKEILVILEDGLAIHQTEQEHAPRKASLSSEAQLSLWRDLAGKWEDDRPTAEILADIRQSRTAGREVRL